MCRLPIPWQLALLRQTDEFVIKQVEPSGEWYKCTGPLNVEELEGKQYPQGFETVEKMVDECLTEAIDGTGWKVIRCDVSKKRTIRIEISGIKDGLSAFLDFLSLLIGWFRPRKVVVDNIL